MYGFAIRVVLGVGDGAGGGGGGGIGGGGVRNCSSGMDGSKNIIIPHIYIKKSVDGVALYRIFLKVATTGAAYLQSGPNAIR